MKRAEPNVLTFIYYSLLYDAVLNFYKPFATKFLQRMGGNEFHISLYNSLPGLVAVFAILPGSVFIKRFVNKKRVTAVLFAVSRTFLLFLITVPFFPEDIRPLLFICVISLMNFPDAISQCSFQSFLGTALNGKMRATAISLRNRFGQIAVMLITLVSGLIITYIPATDAQRIIVYQIFFGISFVFGVLEIIMFTRFIDRPERTKPEGGKLGLTGVAKDGRFMKFLVLTIFFYVTWHAGWPLSSIILIMELGSNEVWLALYAAVSGISAFFAAGYWNRLIHKKGNDFTMIAAALCIGANALAISLAPNSAIMLLVHILNGTASIGVSMVLFNGLLEATPNENRIVYIGVYNTFVNVSLAVSPFISLWLCNALGSRGAMSAVAIARIVSGSVMAAAFILPKRRKAKELK